MNFTAQQIAAFVSGEIIGDTRVEVHDVSPIEDGRPGTLSYVTDAKYLPALAGTAASVVLLTRTLYDASLSCPPTLILVDNARQAIGTLLQGVSEFLRPRKHGVEQPAFVAEGTTLPDDTYIGAFAYIGKGVKLGKGVQIYPQAYIGDYTTIGDNTVIYSGVKIYDHCTIGRDCIIHSGCVIGADGFGFEPDAQGVNRKIPQIGTVVIEDDVEIGANTTIDRAMMGETRVRKNVKIDNLVQVAHNVQVGEPRSPLYHGGSGRRSRTYIRCRSGYLRCTDRRGRFYPSGRSVPGLTGYRCHELAPLVGCIQAPARTATRTAATASQN